MTRKPAFFTLLALFLLFATPVIIAWYFVYEGSWRGAQVNRGYLFQPAVELSSIGWKNIDGSPFLWKNNDQKWAMIYIMPPHCDKQCHEAIYKIHQVRIALNRDQDRFIRVLAIPSSVKEGEVQTVKADRYSKDMLMLAINQEALLKVLGNYPDKNHIEGKIGILDPQQRLVLVYPATVDPEDLLKDLQRLMRAFHLGQSKA